MKQYVHPILGRTITRHPRSFLGKEYYSVSSKLLDISVSISEEELLALGFIEKEEEPDTDTKCIPDYIRGKTYMEGEVVACKNCGGDCTDKWTPKCPQTDTKWIDDALEDYKDGMMSIGSGIYDEKYIFKQAILSNLPKQCLGSYQSISCPKQADQAIKA